MTYTPDTGRPILDFEKLQDNKTTINPVRKGVGDRMKDGTIYAGISPDTGRPMYAAPADAPASLYFNEAAKYSQNLEIGGRKDFRVPTRAELNVLYENRERGELKGTFNQTGVYPSGSYWSSTRNSNDLASTQQFSNGYKIFYDVRDIRSAVRCVR